MWLPAASVCEAGPSFASMDEAVTSFQRTVDPKSEVKPPFSAASQELSERTVGGWESLGS